MMYVAVHFVRADKTETRVETVFPGTPNVGDMCTYYDEDRDEELAGRVTFVHWRDLNGEILVHVHTENAFGRTLLNTP
jgi:hypothetical protein